MIKTIFADFIHIFQPPTAQEMVTEELEQARRELLKAHSAQEYAHHMANYHADRIERLTEFINQQKDPACLSTTLSSGTNEPGPLPQWKTSMSNSVATLKKSLR
jgi:predicted outer membrane protein